MPCISVKGGHARCLCRSPVNRVLAAWLLSFGHDPSPSPCTVYIQVPDGKVAIFPASGQLGRKPPAKINDVTL